MLKKILIGSEILEIDGEEHFKIDLKEEEKMINQESKILSEMGFKQFVILKEN